MNGNHLSDAWISYCEDRLGLRHEDFETTPVSPREAITLLWAWTPLFVDQFRSLVEIEYQNTFDDLADKALLAIARRNGFDVFDIVSSEAWRVLWERLAYVLRLFAQYQVQGLNAVSYLPNGLSRAEQEIALGLVWLLGIGRTISREILPLSPPGKLPDFLDPDSVKGK